MPLKGSSIPQRAPALPERAFEVGRAYLVLRGDVHRPARVLNSRVSKLGIREAYISFVGEDKRLDAWVPASTLGDEVVEAGPSAVANGTVKPESSGAPRNATPGPSRPAEDSEPSTPEREFAAVTRVRNFEDVRFGEYLIKTWYYSPYPIPVDVSTPAPSSALGIDAEPPKKRGRKRKEAPVSDEKRILLPRSASDVMAVGVGKGGEGARGRLWVCDLCFKYMRTRAGWDKHISSCTMLRPPGRKVYQRDNYTMWEIDGAHATLYCQNLSLFGKLFIDHKSVFYHVENFLFYVLCDAATSRRDQVLAFFSKEKLSYDDYNLACIITFPPFQNRGFGKLLMEFSYYLTQHPVTRPDSLSPGTPERPLSDLGLKGYMAYWVSVILRLCRKMLADAAPAPPPKPPSEGRSLRTRQAPQKSVGEKVLVNGIELLKIPDSQHKGHYAVRTTLADLAKACHVRVDDVQLALAELGFLRHRRPLEVQPREEEDGDDGTDDAVGEWKDVEVVITRDAVDAKWAEWRVRDAGVLDERYVLL